MDYLKAIIKYYGCFSAIDFDKYSNRIYFSGKLNLKIIIVWLSASAFLMVITMATTMNDVKGTWTTAIIAIIVVIIVVIKSSIKFRKLEHKPININIYKRELPSNLRPAHVRMLLNDGLIDKKSLAATLLDLIDRGYLNVRRISNKTGNIVEDLFKKDNDIIIYRTEKPIYYLLRYEKFFIKWFIEKYGDGKEVKASKISEGLNSDIYAEEPHSLFRCWQGLVLLSFPFEKFYRKTIATKTKTIYLILTFIGFAWIFSRIGMIIGIYGLGCLLFASPLCVLNKEGTEEKDNWLDLKRYLKDFSNIKEKTIEEVEIWQFYLTYSIALNVKSKANKEISKFFRMKMYTDSRYFRYIRNNYIKILNNSEKPEKSIIEYCAGYSKEAVRRQIEIELGKLDIK